MSRFRRLKPELKEMLLSPDWQVNLSRLQDIPPRRVIGPLFSFLLHGGVLKWRAVTALGLVVPLLAHESREEARIIMRRMIWNLSEESGNLGWGMPEAMGEVMAMDSGLASEYSRVLISYTMDLGVDDTYIEHPPLRRAVYWGMGRLFQIRPELADYAIPSLMNGLEDTEDAQIPGLAAWSVASIGHTPALPLLENLLHSQQEVELYRDRKLEQSSVGALASQAIALLE